MTNEELEKEINKLEDYRQMEKEIDIVEDYRQQAEDEAERFDLNLEVQEDE